MKEFWIFTVYLLLTAAYDWKRQRIPAAVFVFFGFVGVLCTDQAYGWRLYSLGDRAASFFPGIISLFLTWLTRGAMGAGDGCFFLVSALYLSGRELWTLWMGGLLCCSTGGLFVIVHGRREGNSVKNLRLPFLPFLLPVWLLMQF